MVYNMFKCSAVILKLISWYWQWIVFFSYISVFLKLFFPQIFCFYSQMAYLEALGNLNYKDTKKLQQHLKDMPRGKTFENWKNEVRFTSTSVYFQTKASISSLFIQTFE